MSSKKTTPEDEDFSPHWLSVTAYAPLKVVQTLNYLRFGPQGVRRFGPGTVARPDAPPGEIRVNLSIKQASGGELIRYDDFVMHPLRDGIDESNTTLWMGSLDDAHFHASWAWDFYRLFSGVTLAVQAPRPNSRRKVWNSAYRALRDLSPGDQIIMEAHTILQIYPVDGPAVEVHGDAQLTAGN
jgi:hypothetical protein